ncbi:tyrosine-type recombinase/integrase [Salipaludibacillus sp. CUR1]|uniref:tyrosine-type recombinase/integrase n=1 Tax=Salipaludibacillus sp. CUR1 TaxID=2820003 RepID=UPI001E507A0B|nr:tyrosine-type recombinase/integrase [Salipaludibacillus sp. CUR1]
MLIESIQKEFISEKRFEGLTESALNSYVALFKQLNEYLDHEGVEQLEELTPKILKGYLREYKERGNKPKTINSKLKLLRVFSKWLHQEGLTEKVLTEGVKLTREDTSPKIVKTEDIKLALSHLRRAKRREDTFTARRNYVILLFMVGTGLRISELERLNWSDIDFSTYLITIRTSKSRKAQSVPLSESLARELLDWRLYLERKLDKLPEALFVTREGRRFSKNGIQNFFKRLKKKLGITGDFSPHALRAYYIKTLLKNGSNLREVQLLARHSKISVTQGYVGYFAHELKESLDNSNPLRDLL